MGVFLDVFFLSLLYYMMNGIWACRISEIILQFWNSFNNGLNILGRHMIKVASITSNISLPKIWNITLWILHLPCFCFFFFFFYVKIRGLQTDHVLAIAKPRLSPDCYQYASNSQTFLSPSKAHNIVNVNVNGSIVHYIYFRGISTQLNLSDPWPDI